MNKFNQYKVYQGLKPIKSLLPKDVRKLISSHQNSFDDLKSKWNTIVGNDSKRQQGKDRNECRNPHSPKLRDI